MDPNANLQEQESILFGARYAGETKRERAARLRELREALYGWLSGGGFQPEWSAVQRGTCVLFRQWERRCGLIERGTF